MGGILLGMLRTIGTTCIVALSRLRAQVLVALLLACSCSSGTTERVGITHAALQGLTSNTPISQDSSTGYCETSGAVVYDQWGFPTVVFGYNRSYGHGWAYSTDFGDDYTVGTSTLPQVSLPDGHLIAYYGSDPTVVATGWANQVVITTVVVSTANNLYVVLRLSSDGGQNFQRAVVMSDGASGGAVDQPIAASDGQGTIYVSWRNTSNWTTWQRRAHIDSGGFTINLDNKQQIDGALPAGLGTNQVPPNFNTGRTGDMNVSVQRTAYA